MNAQNNSAMMGGVSAQATNNIYQMEKAIESCEHKDELQLFASQHNTALCNECYFEN